MLGESASWREDPYHGHILLARGGMGVHGLIRGVETGLKTGLIDGYRAAGLRQEILKGAGMVSDVLGEGGILTRHEGKMLGEEYFGPKFPPAGIEVATVNKAFKVGYIGAMPVGLASKNVLVLIGTNAIYDMQTVVLDRGVHIGAFVGRIKGDNYCYDNSRSASLVTALERYIRTCLTDDPDIPAVAPASIVKQAMFDIARLKGLVRYEEDFRAE